MIEEKKSFWKKVIHKLFKSQRRYIKKYVGKHKSDKIAIYYHKFIANNERDHSNNQEVKGIIESLTNLGYIVYLLDKQCSSIHKSIQRPSYHHKKGISNRVPLTTAKSRMF